MSIGQKFIKEKKELSDQERIIDLESRLPVLIERIQSYDKIVDENKILINQIDDLNKKISLLKIENACRESDFLKLQKSFNEFIKICHEDSLKNDNQYNIIKNDISEFKDQISEQSDDISQFFKEYDQLVIELCEKFISKQDHKDNLILIFNDFKSLNDILIKTNNDLNETRNIVFQLNNWKNEIIKDSNKKQSDLSELQEFLGKNDYKYQKDIAQIYLSLSEQKESLLESIKDNIESAKKYIDSKPSSIEYIRKEFISKLESVQLDSDNAVQKSSNNDKSIKLLEKKLENLSLLIKKIELS